MAVWREKYKTEKSEINMNLIKIQQIIKIKGGEKTNFLDDFFKLTFFFKEGHEQYYWLYNGLDSVLAVDRSVAAVDLIRFM